MEDLEEAAPNPVVARVDAFMQKRRSSPLAGEGDDLPVLTEVIDPDGDLPILLEEEMDPAMAAGEQASEAYDPAVLNILSHELARHMQEHLATEIPDLIAAALESAMPAVARELHDRLMESTETVIQDFLAEREKLAKIQQQR